MTRIILQSAASIGALVLATSAQAQVLPAETAPAPADATTESDIVVTGTIVSGEMKSIEAQRRADNIVNVLTADGIGRLPDRNAAEAVQRLPGVAIERDQGEGRFVAVRGLPSQWNSTLINGNRLPTAEEETTSRATAFDFFPSELIDQVVVAKAITPDMEGDAIGGSVNFITKTAPDKRVLQATVGGNYSEKANKAGYLASLLYGDRLGDGKLGFVLSGTYYKRNWATDNYEPRRGGDGIGITRLELRDYTGVRETIGLNGAVEYAFDDGGKIYARGIYGSLKDNETHYKHRLNFASNRVEVQNIFNTLITELSGGEVGGVHMLGGEGGAKFDWKVSRYANLFHYGDTPDGRDNSYFVVRFDQRNVGYQGLENRGAGNLAYNEIDGGSDPANAIGNHLPSGFRMDPLLTRLANVELYKIRVKETDRIVLEGNVTLPAGDTMTFKAGGKYRDKLRDAFFEDLFYTWNPAAGAVPTLADFPLIGQPRGSEFLDRAVTEAVQDHAGLGLAEHPRMAGDDIEQYCPGRIDVAVICDAHRQGDAPQAAAIGEVGYASRDQIGVGDDDLVAVERFDVGRAKCDLADVAGVGANLDPVANLDRPFDQQDDAAHEIGDHRLQAESDADRERPGDERQAREIEAGGGDGNQSGEGEAEIAEAGEDGGSRAGFDVQAV